LLEQLEAGVVENGVAAEPEPPVKRKATPATQEATPSAVEAVSTNAGDAKGSAADLRKIAPPEEPDDGLSPEELERKKAAKEFLTQAPVLGVVRYTFAQDGVLGLRLSRDVPPWILEVRDGSLSAKKAPRVPVGGVVMAVNGYELTEKDNQLAIKGLAKRPVIIDVKWPEDQGKPMVNRA